MSFEESIRRLEEIVTLLGDGNTTLEQSLALYTEGASLIERCSKQLSDAKLKMETLLPKKEVEE